MYGSGSVLGAGATTAGILILPNTGDNILLLAISIFTIAIGSLVILSTVIRLIAKKAYKA